MNLAFWDPFFFILTLGNMCSSLLIALGDVSWGSSYQVLFLKYCKLFLHSLKALHELRCTVGSMFSLTVENYGDDTNLQKFFGEAIWFMVIWKTKGVLTCNTYVNTWANTYRYFHNTCRYCKLSSPVSIDTIPTGIIMILEISNFNQ